MYNHTIQFDDDVLRSEGRRRVSRTWLRNVCWLAASIPVVSQPKRLARVCACDRDEESSVNLYKTSSLRRGARGEESQDSKQTQGDKTMGGREETQ